MSEQINFGTPITGIEDASGVIHKIDYNKGLDNPVGLNDNSGLGEIFGDYENNHAKGKNSEAHGSHTAALGDDSAVFGRYNEKNSEKIFQIGIGIGESVFTIGNFSANEILSDDIYNKFKLSTLPEEEGNPFKIMIKTTDEKDWYLTVSDYNETKILDITNNENEAVDFEFVKLNNCNSKYKSPIYNLKRTPENSRICFTYERSKMLLLYDSTNNNFFVDEEGNIYTNTDNYDSDSPLLRSDLTLFKIKSDDIENDIKIDIKNLDESLSLLNGVEWGDYTEEDYGASYLELTSKRELVICRKRKDSKDDSIPLYIRRYFNVEKEQDNYSFTWEDKPNGQTMNFSFIGLETIKEYQLQAIIQDNEKYIVSKNKIQIDIRRDSLELLPSGEDDKDYYYFQNFDKIKSSLFKFNEDVFDQNLNVNAYPFKDTSHRYLGYKYNPEGRLDGLSIDQEGNMNIYGSLTSKTLGPAIFGSATNQKLGGVKVKSGTWKTLQPVYINSNNFITLPTSLGNFITMTKNYQSRNDGRNRPEKTDFAVDFSELQRPDFSSLPSTYSVQYYLQISYNSKQQGHGYHWVKLNNEPLINAWENILLSPPIYENSLGGTTTSVGFGHYLYDKYVDYIKSQVKSIGSLESIESPWLPQISNYNNGNKDIKKFLIPDRINISDKLITNKSKYIIDLNEIIIPLIKPIDVGNNKNYDENIEYGKFSLYGFLGKRHKRNNEILRSNFETLELKFDLFCDIFQDSSHTIPIEKNILIAKNENIFKIGFKSTESVLNNNNTTPPTTVFKNGIFDKKLIYAIIK